MNFTTRKSSIFIKKNGRFLNLLGFLDELPLCATLKDDRATIN